MSPRERLTEKERKKEIMESAAKVILKKGYANTTMDEVISGTTLSKGGVYHYYSNTADIFKDLMLEGLEYRKKVIESQIAICPKEVNLEFVAEQVTTKIIDENPYMPLYAEFLMAKAREPKLEEAMKELEQINLIMLNAIFGEEFNYWEDEKLYRFLTDFVNALILACQVLGARASFTENKEAVKKMIMLLLKKEGE